MTGGEIRVRGTTDAGVIAVVVALLGRDRAPRPAPTGVTAWQRTRRAALSTRTPRAPRPR